MQFQSSGMRELLSVVTTANVYLRLVLISWWFSLAKDSNDQLFSLIPRSCSHPQPKHHIKICHFSPDYRHTIWPIVFGSFQFGFQTRPREDDRVTIDRLVEYDCCNLWVLVGNDKLLDSTAAIALNNGDEDEVHYSVRW